ncbi:hypothetical protein TTHERM_01323730 (macronuclear) [Tetrahymena thermophila SB210]|uniref:Uncharacterized protein n=1 Tax=Tetrahymena thermophila (strain SB210) TaxID=312017 RepID=Q23H56_TETTS|nr:hypothetical protein TTHERM_01323730 [Tetrahymena thermophila SB210]EAR95870.2 hypothetical protein TTHERM_01323730 [Tetrahymena thermophila SB210]|eukprot:XP_001016115.2 hypothetical protein TTHERM_01323730 [Tetrahymena thermophila SB210]
MQNSVIASNQAQIGGGLQFMPDFSIDLKLFSKKKEEHRTEVRKNVLQDDFSMKRLSLINAFSEYDRVFDDQKAKNVEDMETFDNDKKEDEIGQVQRYFIME